ncbi:MAG: hypothetical protein OCC49_05375 [Fibrobacterales bacterium]
MAQTSKTNLLNWRDFIDSNNPIGAALMTKMGYKKEEIPRIKAQKEVFLIHSRHSMPPLFN